jgi:hypothetical protein
MSLSPDVILGTMLAAVLTMSGWTLFTVHGLSNASAAREEKDKAQDDKITENRARIIRAEEEINRLQVDVAKL